MGMFVPQYSLIQSITPGVQTVVTFTAPCDFLIGQVVSFRVSPQSGTKELNNVESTVIGVTSSTITVNIDSRNFTPYIFLPENEQVHVAMVVPSSSGIIPGVYPAQTNLADAFDQLPPP